MAEYILRSEGLEVGFGDWLTVQICIHLWTLRGFLLCCFPGVGAFDFVGLRHRYSILAFAQEHPPSFSLDFASSGAPTALLNGEAHPK